MRALHSLVEDPRIECDGIAEAVLRDVSALRANAALRPGLMDRLIQADYASSGVDLVTFDRDLARLPGTRQL